MNERVKDKFKEMEKFLDELSQIVPHALEEYQQDFEAKAACERYAERIIEASIDLALIFIKAAGLRLPENDLEVFDIIKEKMIIPDLLSERLKDAKRMRNILAHEYGQVDDEIVFHAVKEEMPRDIKEFISLIKKSVFGPKTRKEK